MLLEKRSREKIFPTSNYQEQTTFNSGFYKNLQTLE
jgi:hypothetical protein